MLYTKSGHVVVSVSLVEPSWTAARYHLDTFQEEVEEKEVEEKEVELMGVTYREAGSFPCSSFLI